MSVIAMRCFEIGINYFLYSETVRSGKPLDRREQQLSKQLLEGEHPRTLLRYAIPKVRLHGLDVWMTLLKSLQSRHAGVVRERDQENVAADAAYRLDAPLTIGLGNRPQLRARRNRNEIFGGLL